MEVLEEREAFYTETKTGENNIMRKYVYLMGQILALFFSVQTISQSHEVSALQKESNLELSVYGSLQEQQKSYLKTNMPSPKRLIPETNHYDTTGELQGGENIYQVPKAKNRLGFLCGRCNFVGLYSQHPNRDCCSFKKTATTPDSVLIVLYNLMAAAVGFSSYVVSVPCYLRSMDIFTSASLIPQLISFPLCLSGTAACLTEVYCMSCLTLSCAEYMNHQEFVESYRRGQLYLPDDWGSYTCLTGTSWAEWVKKYEKVEGFVNAHMC